MLNPSAKLCFPKISKSLQTEFTAEAHLAEGKLLKDRLKRKSGNNSNDGDDDEDDDDRDKSRYLPFTRTVLLLLVLVLQADNLEPNFNNFRKTP
jgi:hypothetical protein